MKWVASESQKAHQELGLSVHGRWCKVQKLVFCFGRPLCMQQTPEPPETSLG